MDTGMERRVANFIQAKEESSPCPARSLSNSCQLHNIYKVYVCVFLYNILYNIHRHNTSLIDLYCIDIHKYQNKYNYAPILPKKR